MIDHTVRRAFEDSLTFLSEVDQIRHLYEGAGFVPPSPPKQGGFGRRALVERYHEATDWQEAASVDRVLGVWATHLNNLDCRLEHDETRRLLRELATRGFVYRDGRIERGSPSLADFEVPSDSVWARDHFKLFVSHVSSFKSELSKLKEELEFFNVSAFLAHEDIKPSSPWQVVIEAALVEMDALVAVLTEGFSASEWTDQEVGYALGRGVLTIPLRFEIDPYGFLGRDQAMNARERTVNQLAADLVALLIRHPKTRERMGNALASRLARSTGYKMSRQIADILRTAVPLSEHAIRVVERSFNANPEIYNAAGVAQILSAIIGKDLDAEGA